MGVLKRDLRHSCLPSSFPIEGDAAADVEGKMMGYGCIVNHHLAFPGFR